MRLGVSEGDSKESILPSKLPSKCEQNGVFKAVSMIKTLDKIIISILTVK